MNEVTGPYIPRTSQIVISTLMNKTSGLRVPMKSIHQESQIRGRDAIY